MDTALARLVDTAMTHFGLEESLMAATACPGAREQQACHAQLIAQVQDLARGVRQGRGRLTPAQLDFLQDWVVCHIQAEGLPLGRHLRMTGH